MAMTMPFEWAKELQAAKKWYSNSRGWRLVCEYDAAGAPWSVRFPQMLLDWGNCHRVAIFEVERFFTVFLTGFNCPERQLLLHKAIQELRRAEKAIAADKERALAYADRGLKSFGGRPFRWGTTEAALRVTTHANSLGPAPLPSDMGSGMGEPVMAELGASPATVEPAAGEPETAGPESSEPSGPLPRPIPALPPSLPQTPSWGPPGMPSWGAPGPSPSSHSPAMPSSGPRPISGRPGGGFGGGRR